MLTIDKTIEERLQELEVLISAAAVVLAKFPFQTSIRQNISILKDRRRELLKERAIQAS